MKPITFLLHRNYWISSGFKQKVRRKLTPAGTVIGLSAGLSAAIGIDTNQSMAYQSFVLLAGVFVVGFAWSLWRAPRFTATRILPRVGTAGEPLRYRIQIANPNRASYRAVSVSEDFGDPRPTFREFANQPEPGEKKRNAFDRFLRYYRWMWILAGKQIATSMPAAVPLLKTGGVAEVEACLIPKRRGHLRLTGFEFALPDPFGLFRTFSRQAQPGSLLILPRRYRLPRVSLGGASQYQPGGISLAASVGESEEFLSTREYRRGDPSRHIHWKSTSKTGRLIVKEFQNEFFVRQALVLDTFLEAPDRPVFEEAVSVAASFALTLNTQESLLDLLFVGTEAICLTAGHGVAQMDHLLEVLAAVEPATQQDFAALEGIVLRQIRRVSGCVSIFLRWDDSRRQLVERVDALGIPQLVLVMKRPGDKMDEIRLEKSRFARVHLVDAARPEESLSRL